MAKFQIIYQQTICYVEEVESENWVGAIYNARESIASGSYFDCVVSHAEDANYIIAEIKE